MSKGIKSKSRVKGFGEVFTPDSIVNDMLDLVDEQMDTGEKYIDSTFLEPSCGDGQFLIRILYRKMIKVSELPVEKRAAGLIRALASIYGVDIQADNVQASKDRMFDVATGKEVVTFDLKGKDNIIKVDLGIEYTEKLEKAIQFVLDNNIICGNTLTGDVQLTSYKFDNQSNKVKLAQAMLNSLNIEFNETDWLDVMSLGSVEYNTDDNDDDFEF